MCDYIFTSFIELNNNHFNYSDYTVKGNGTIKWFHPAHTEFENPLNVIILDNYKYRELWATMQAKSKDPKLFFFIDNFIQALWIVDYWLENSDRGMSSRTGFAMDDWISTCCKLPQHFRINNTWTIPAFLPWYKISIAQSTPIFLTFIEQKLDLPYAIARNAIPTRIAYSLEMVKDWEQNTNEFFTPHNAPFPKCSAIRGFLYKISLWDPLGASPRIERGQNKLRDDYIIFIQSSGYIEWFRRNN